MGELSLRIVTWIFKLVEYTKHTWIAFRIFGLRNRVLITESICYVKSHLLSNVSLGRFLLPFWFIWHKKSKSLCSHELSVVRPGWHWLHMCTLLGTCLVTLYMLTPIIWTVFFICNIYVNNSRNIWNIWFLLSSSHFCQFILKGLC